MNKTIFVWTEKNRIKTNKETGASVNKKIIKPLVINLRYHEKHNDIFVHTYTIAQKNYHKQKIDKSTSNVAHIYDKVMFKNKEKSCNKCKYFAICNKTNKNSLNATKKIVLYVFKKYLSTPSFICEKQIINKYDEIKEEIVVNNEEKGV